MPKKSPTLLHKLPNLLKISIFLAKLKKPIIPKLIFLKKIRKLKKMKLLKQYNHYYSYVKEYEFSPSNTPLIQFQRKNGKMGFRKMYSNVVLFSKCLGTVRGGGEMGFEIENGVGRNKMGIDLWEDDDISVDERAERFIQRFYEEMRRQRVESNFQMK
ncbi:hypothetical protein DH2020_020725 [Rehmannia glutinosa]|uniref:Cotton fiber protein n=1 Tax=Rehmannia glutinosa TaxID=99300 RepID=A0ABR0WGZ0_REHGL